MKKYLILCVDDERDVLDSVIQDLSPLEEYFVIEAAESVSEAQEVIADAVIEGMPLALILCDHIMPEYRGVDFLITLKKQEHTEHAKKLLLTGQADLEATIQAVNSACLDYFITKPWDGDSLLKTVTDQLTNYMIENEKDLMPWARVLDTVKIFDTLNQRRSELGSD
ncbi:response regulator [Aliivibrio kagoshimensis]|jgi:response regulator RpfG family c-di-GMP phosphodiesterase|uniref:response regulator n=1 Tax=Aliivibrio kagoshimensis TaxID=2910230 RepID=UPI003D12A52B